MSQQLNSTIPSPGSMAVRRPVATVPSAGGSNLTPKEILDIIHRHVFLIFVTTVIGIVLGIAGYFVILKLYPRYTSFTYIEVLQPGMSDPTEISTPQANKDIQFQFRSSKAADLKRQSTFEQLLQKPSVRQTDWFASLGGADDIVGVMDNLDKHLSVVPERDREYIRVAMTTCNGKESALIVNELIDLFIRSQQARAESGVAGKLKQLDEQRARILQQMTNINNYLAEIRLSSQLTQLGEQTDDFRHTITQKLASLEIDRSKLIADIKQLEANAKALQERQSGEDIIQRQTENDPVVQNLKQRISELEAELARQMAKLGENHRIVQSTRELIRKTREEKDMIATQKAAQIYRSDVRTAEEQLSVFTNRLNELERQRIETEEEQKKLDGIREKYEEQLTLRQQKEDQLKAVDEQIEKYRLLREDSDTAKVRQLGLAQPPLKVSFPRLIIFTPAGTILGLMFGTALAFLIEMLNELVRTPRDVTRNINIPLLGMIAHRSQEDLKNVEIAHIVRLAPYSIMAECYRQIRANLKQSASAENQKVIFVTSCTAGEGRTTVSCNLAGTFVAEEQKVLIIDANFRRPAMSKLFPPPGTEFIDNLGLSGYLCRNVGLDGIIRPSGFENLDIIDSGILPANPAELLYGPQMKELLNHCRQNYDHIIIDGPPTLVSDAKSLAARADGVIVVYNAAITKRGAAQRIVRELNDIKATILGAILVGVRTLKGGYFEEMFDSYRKYQQQAIKPAQKTAKAKA